MIKVNRLRLRYDNELSDVIISLEWEYLLEGFKTISGTLDLPKPSDIFIPIDEIDQSILVGWVEKFVNPAEKELQPLLVEEVIKIIEL